MTTCVNTVFYPLSQAESLYYMIVHNVPAEVDLARPVYSAHLLLLLLLLVLLHDCHWCCHECVVVTIAPPTSIQYHMYQQRLQFWLYHTPSQS